MRDVSQGNKKVAPLCSNCGKPHLYSMGEVECRMLRPRKKVAPPLYLTKSKHFSG